MRGQREKDVPTTFHHRYFQRAVILNVAKVAAVVSGVEIEILFKLEQTAVNDVHLVDLDEKYPYCHDQDYHETEHHHNLSIV